MRTSTVPVRGCATAVLVTDGLGVGEAVDRAMGFGRCVAVGSAPGTGVSMLMTDGISVGPASVASAGAAGLGVSSWLASGVSISVTDPLSDAPGVEVGVLAAAGLASSPVAGEGDASTPADRPLA